MCVCAAVIGTKLGQYIVDLNSKLGSGGYGTVYVGEVVVPAPNTVHAPKKGARVAFKVLAKDPELTPQRILQEINFLQALTDACAEHVPVFYDYGKMPDGAVFMVTELMTTALGKVHHPGYIKRWTKTAESSPQAVEAVWKQIVNAVHCLHAHGVIHGDVKPDNFLVKFPKGKAPIIKISVA
jgi:serine/threonine protein kinase